MLKQQTMLAALLLVAGLAMAIEVQVSLRRLLISIEHNDEMQLVWKIRPGNSTVPASYWLGTRGCVLPRDFVADVHF